MHSTQTWASTRLCEMMGQMTVMDQQHKLARPAQLTTTYQPNAFSKFYVYRIDCNFRFIKIPARSEGTCVADAEANYFSSFAGQKNYVIANLVAPILLELGKAARKEDTRGRKWGKKIEAPSEMKDSPIVVKSTCHTTDAADALSSGKASTEHYAAFAGKRKYVISNLFLPVLLKLQIIMEQKSMAALSKSRGEVK